jgi:osmoprotectant transport system substrate-binding protein
MQAAERGRGASQEPEKHPSVAKASVDFVALVARLKSCPFKAKGISAACIAVLATAVALPMVSCAPPRADHPVIGAKNFTEQVVLGELLAQEIEAKTGLPVERRFYLAGSYICHQALIAGRIDAYVEYTGTALTAILKQPVDRDPGSALATVRRLYGSRYGVTVAPPLGFENSFAMIVRGGDARRLHLTTLSEAAKDTPEWRLGVGYEFEERPDGLRGLAAAYGLRFAGPPRTMDLGLLYRALSGGQVDMIAGNSTDGPIEALGLTVLEDDRHYFPPYQAVPLVRDDALRRWPGIQTALDALAGRITADDMRGMNEAVDGQHRDPAEVVREFRLRRGL